MPAGGSYVNGDQELPGNALEHDRILLPSALKPLDSASGRQHSHPVTTIIHAMIVVCVASLRLGVASSLLNFSAE